MIVENANPSFKSSFTDPEARHSAGRFGMTLFLVSLAVIFAATALCLVVVRVELTSRDQWPTDLPPLPWSMAISTLVLIVSSVSMQRAVNVARALTAEEGPTTAFRRSLSTTTALGGLFLVLQGICWWAWLSVVQERWAGSEAYRVALTAFYLLTGLHGLHVVGGVVALARTLIRDQRGVYNALDRYERTHYCAMYWHFLGVIWLALYAMLLVWG